MYQSNLEDEHLCRMCFDRAAQPNSVFCATCDRKPIADAASTLKDAASVSVTDVAGNVIYAASLPEGADVHAAMKDMFQALYEKGYPIIQIASVEERED